jgi:hypothetical protein
LLQPLGKPFDPRVRELARLAEELARWAAAAPPALLELAPNLDAFLPNAALQAIVQICNPPAPQIGDLDGVTPLEDPEEHG